MSRCVIVGGADIENYEKLNKEFGIGPLNLSSVYIYNSRTMYGTQMTFEVSNFR